MFKEITAQFEAIDFFYRYHNDETNTFELMKEIIVKITNCPGLSMHISNWLLIVVTFIYIVNEDQ